MALLRAEVDEDRIQALTGCRFHASYLPARLRWLARTEPATVATVTRWMSLGEYVWLRLLGDTAFGLGLIVYPMSGTIDGVNGDHVLLAPPFIMDDDQVDEVVSKLERAVSAVL